MASELMTGAFWSATIERMIRSFAAAILGVYFGGEVVFDVLNVNWTEVLACGAGASFFTLLFCIAGNTVSGNGPAFQKSEKVTPTPPA